MNKKYFYVLLIVIVLASVGFFVYKKTEKKIAVYSFEECISVPGNIILESYPRTCRTSDGTFFVEQVSPTPSVEDKSDRILVYNPKPNQVIKSPLMIEGSARGGWFFEGQFSGELLDANGKQIAIFHTTSQSDWMTSEFVPFKATLLFKNPETKTGVLVFKKDNPSDMREFDDQYSFPVQFDESTMLNLQVYFGNSTLAPNDLTCSKTYPVIRTIPGTSAPARAAIFELLKGVTAAERAKGYETAINEGVVLQKINIIEGTAYVDFNNTLQDKVGGSCMITAISSQIISTLKQFPTVKNVVISINGNTEDILQP